MTAPRAGIEISIEAGIDAIPAESVALTEYAIELADTQSGVGASGALLEYALDSAPQSPLPRHHADTAARRWAAVRRT